MNAVTQADANAKLAAAFNTLKAPGRKLQPSVVATEEETLAPMLVQVGNQGFSFMPKKAERYKAALKQHG